MKIIELIKTNNLITIPEIADVLGVTPVLFEISFQC